jgi:hypothetical protein
MTAIDIDLRKHSACAPSPPSGGEGRGEGASPRIVALRGERSLAMALNGITLGAADWLSLAAAPTFAVMALLTGVLGGKPDVLCAAIQGTSPLNGMVPMYLLMSAFHLAPWLKLIFGKRASACAGEVEAGSPTRTCANDRIESMFRFRRNGTRSRAHALIRETS